MNISPRFTEFGMTGAFFWISQTLFFGLGYGQTLVDIIPQWVKVWNGYQAMLPQVMQDTAGSLLTAFGIIGIFVTGLILDLLGSYFALLELTIFSRHLVRNRSWLDTLARQCPKNVKNDYEKLRDGFSTNFFVSPKKAWQRILMARECKHMQTFLFSYIHVFSSLSETLVDNMHLWRTARAISTTLLILAVEVIYLKYTGSILTDWTLVSLNMILFVLSAFITLRSYIRLCFSLFSLACATYKKTDWKPTPLPELET